MNSFVRYQELLSKDLSSAQEIRQKAENINTAKAEKEEGGGDAAKRLLQRAGLTELAKKSRQAQQGSIIWNIKYAEQKPIQNPLFEDNTVNNKPPSSLLNVAKTEKPSTSQPLITKRLENGYEASSDSGQFDKATNDIIDKLASKGNISQSDLFKSLLQSHNRGGVDIGKSFIGNGKQRATPKMGKKSLE
eukprot:m.263706 g.263706  ORF g.263706 m.263706 type:complete len:190 (-) comp16227_c0_seq84:999-1568(-)